MNNTATDKLKSSFREVFPEYAKHLEDAKSQSEVKKIAQTILDRSSNESGKST